MLYVKFQDFLGKSDPYLEISKRASDGSWQVVHRTEVSQIFFIFAEKYSYAKKDNDISFQVLLNFLAILVFSCMNIHVFDLTATHSEYTIDYNILFINALVHA